MPKPTKGPRLGGTPAHQRIILANLASQLFEHGRITTTEAKAKRVRPLAEQLITKAKRGDLHNRRQVMRTITDTSVVHVLFTEIAPSFEDRDGGYLRITKVGNRKGDNAPMAVIELVSESVEDSRKAKGRTVGSNRTTAPASPAASNAVADPAPTDPAAEELTADGHAQDAVANGDASTYGEGSYVGAQPPAGYDVKGNADSMKYHTTESPWYESTVAEVWFNSAEAAEKAGFAAAVQPEGAGDAAEAAAADEAPAANDAAKDAQADA